MSGVKGIIGMHRFNICLVVVLLWCENTMSEDGRTQTKIVGGGAVRGSDGHPAADLASEKGHLLAKRALFPTITGGGGQLPPPPPARYGPGE